MGKAGKIVYNNALAIPQGEIVLADAKIPEAEEVMPAYSFKKQFVNPIRVGLGLSLDLDFHFDAMTASRLKRQTIRAEGKRRHARQGEIVQLYHGMRTRQCFKIGEGRCTNARAILIIFGSAPVIQIGQSQYERGIGVGYMLAACFNEKSGLDAFARCDGFQSWAEMRKFWNEEHGDLATFAGVLIEWEPLK